MAGQPHPSSGGGSRRWCDQRRRSGCVGRIWVLAGLGSNNIVTIAEERQAAIE